jgi:NAD-dependent SIR2 family protein deacetylase
MLYKDEMAQAERGATLYCSECQHEVEPETARSASMLAGTVIVVDRCPGCQAILRARS